MIHHNTTVERFLTEFDNFPKETKRYILDCLLEKYTVNQTIACRLADTNVQDLVRAIQNNKIQPVHLYDNGRQRIHRIYFKEEIQYYAKEKAIIRNVRKNKYI